MDPALLTNFGAAGLIAGCWLLERRAAMVRDKQLAEAHAKLMTERQGFDMLVALAQDCTRALAALEATQREMREWMTRSRRRKS